MELVKLSRAQIRQLYRRDVLRDFPEAEVRPLSQAMKMMDGGAYEGLALTEKGTMRGYALFVKHGPHFVLDLFAVLPPFRGRGYGSAFLHLLREELKTAGSFLAEVEDPAFARNEAERSERERRMRFYLENGCRDTGARVVVFCVPYALITCGGSMQDAEELLKVYRMHYRAVMSGRMYRKYIRG